MTWTPEARRTLDEVIEFIDRDSPQEARTVLQQTLNAAASLRTLPERGRVVPERADSSIREVFVYQYRLMYRVLDDSVEILAFIHGARDFERWRGEP